MENLPNFTKISEAINRVIPVLVSEAATEHFKSRFREKQWNGNPWPETKHLVSRGSLMVRSSKLMNSIRPTTVMPHKIIISAGGQKVPYAQIHNEGGTTHPLVSAKMKRFAWAQYYKNFTKKGNLRKKGSATEASMWKAIALKKQGEKLNITIPKRQYMGLSDDLKNTIETIFKQHLQI